MEDHLIEKNNGLNGMSADDLDDELGGTEGQGLDDVDFQMISSPPVISAAGTEGSVGSDAFTTLAQYYKAHDGDMGLRQRKRTNVSYSEDDQHQETHIQNDPFQLMKRPSMTLDLNNFDQPVEYKPHELIDNPWDEDDFVIYSSDTDVDSPMISSRRTVIGAAGTEGLPLDDFFDNSLDIEEKLAEVCQMISPHRTVIGAAGTHEHRIDIPGGNSNVERNGWDFELIFVITNVVLESMSAIFTQLSSKQKPQYALFGVLLSYLALFTCIIEIIYEGHQQIPIQRDTLSNNRSQRGKSFATVDNIVALACALGECVVTTINYRFEGLIKLTVLPIILANGVLFSKILKYWQRSNTLISFKKSQ